MTCRGMVTAMRMNQLLAATAQVDFFGRKRGVFMNPSSLRWRVVRMISTNSLAAFTQEITRTRPGTEASPAQRNARSDRPEAEQVVQRKLDAVPPAPAKPLPRGSLLDLRV
jgi:hypothetical protein